MGGSAWPFRLALCSSGERRKVPSSHIRTCLNSLLCFRCDGSLLRFFFSLLFENYSYIVSTLPGVLLVFEGRALLQGGVEKEGAGWDYKVLEKPFILFHPQTPPACSLLQLFSTISSSHLPEPRYSILIFLSFHHLIPPHPVPSLLLPFS